MKKLKLKEVEMLFTTIGNRWRGHGNLFTISFNGNIAYAFYWLIISSIILGYQGITYSYKIPVAIYSFIVNYGYFDIFTKLDHSGTITFHWYWGFFIMALYILGESFAWGKWVGFLSTEKNDPLVVEYDNDDGRSFPWIHYIANKIIDQTKNYHRYCQLALAIRGLFWWVPLFSVLGFMVGHTLIGFSIGIMVGLAFPLAVWLGSKIFSFTFEVKSLKLYCRCNWERQELVYGLIQGISIWCFILCILSVSK